MVFPFQWNRFWYFLLQALAVHPWVASKFQFIARENPYTKPTKTMGIFHVGHLETHPSDHRQSFLLGLLPHPHPPQKKKTWHNISAYFSHWAPKHVSVWSFCRLACLDTLAVSGRSQILVHDSDRLISFETSLLQCWTKTTEPTMNWWQKAGWFCECALLINQAHPEAPESTHWIAWEFYQLRATLIHYLLPYFYHCFLQSADWNPAPVDG